MKRWIAVLCSCVCLLFSGTLAAQEASPAPRTQYESFDLSTPEAAVQTFIDVFQNRDYAGLFLILAPEAQQQWYAAFSVFRFELIIDEAASDALFDATEDFIGFDHTEAEHFASNMPYFFDSVMLFAEQNDAFPIDLRGAAEILGTEESAVPSSGEAEGGDEDTTLPAVDVLVSTEAEGELRFRMVQVPSGRWRVYQVIAPDGDAEFLPWAVALGSDGE